MRLEKTTEACGGEKADKLLSIHRRFSGPWIVRGPTRHRLHPLPRPGAFSIQVAAIRASFRLPKEPQAKLPASTVFTLLAIALKRSRWSGTRHQELLGSKDGMPPIAQSARRLQGDEAEEERGHGAEVNLRAEVSLPGNPEASRVHRGNLPRDPLRLEVCAGCRNPLSILQVAPMPRAAIVKLAVCQQEAVGKQRRRQ